MREPGNECLKARPKLAPFQNGGGDLEKYVWKNRLVRGFKWLNECLRSEISLKMLSSKCPFDIFAKYSF